MIIFIALIATSGGVVAYAQSILFTQNLPGQTFGTVQTASVSSCCNNPQSSFPPASQLVYFGEGGVLALFLGSSGGVYYSSSSDGGSTWTTPTELTSSGTGSSDFSVWDPNPGSTTIYYAISSGGASSSFLFASATISSSNGQYVLTASSEISVPTFYTTGSSISLIVDSGGDIWVAVGTTDSTNNAYVELWNCPLVVSSDNCLSVNEWGYDPNTFYITSATPFTSSVNIEVNLLPLSSSSVALLYTIEPDGNAAPIVMTTLTVNGIIATVTTTQSVGAGQGPFFSDSTDGNNVYVAGTYINTSTLVAYAYFFSWSGTGSSIYQTNIASWDCSSTGSSTCFLPTSVSSVGSNTIVVFLGMNINGINYIESTDGGSTFTQPAQIATDSYGIYSQGSFSQSPSPANLEAGALYWGDVYELDFVQLNL
jgi:hypothetical protein